MLKRVLRNRDNTAKAIISVAIATLAMTGCKRAGSSADLPKHISADGFDVLLVTLDTTRADRIGCYGHQPAETPNLDRLAEHGVLFEQAITSATSTLPSHATIMTGLSPLHHGAHENGKSRLTDAHTTLAEHLKGAGYDTAAFVSTFVLDARFGISQGFDTYEFEVGAGLRGPAETLVHERRADDTTRSAIHWLKDRKKEDVASAPYFLWVHYFDPHYTYDSPLASLDRFKDRPYDAEIAFVDLQLGHLLAAIDKHGRRDKTLIVVASDHGEGLYDHDEAFHGIFLYESTLHSVLILSCNALFPEAYRVSDRLVGNVDIAPTILDVLGLPATGPLDGINLLRGTTEADRAIYIETYFSRTVGCRELFGLRRLRDKFILAPRSEYYDLQRDPKELRNLIADAPPAAMELRSKLETMLAAAETDSDATRAMSPEERERLAALGYVSSAESSNNEALPDPKDHIELINGTTEVGHLIGAGKLEEALALTRELLAESNAYDLLLRQHVEILERLGRKSEAADALRDFNARYPSVDMLIFAAERYRAWGDAREYEDALAAASILDPRCGMVFKLRADDALQRGAFTKAVTLYEQALELDPQRLGGEVHYRLREARAGLAQREASESDLDESR